MIRLDQDDMVQALSLTKAGRLVEATELIQQTLRSPSSRAPSGAASQPPPVFTVPKSAPSTDTHRRNPLSAAAKALQRSFASPQGLQIPTQQYPDVLLRQGQFATR